MIKFAELVDYETALSLKNQYIFYTGFFFHELSRFFKASSEDEENSHDAWIFFDKGKMILFFDKKEKIFFEEKISLIKKRQDFVGQIFPINNDPLALELIKTAEIIHHIDSDFSAEIWLHQEDVKFITSYMIPDLTINQIHQKFWLDQMEHRVKSEKIPPKRLHFYLYDHQNKMPVNSHVAANIINDFQIDFYISRKNEIVIPYHKCQILKRKISLYYRHFSIFQIPIEALDLNN